MISYKFKASGLDGLLKLKIGNKNVKLSGQPNEEKKGEVNPAIFKNKVRIFVKCTGPNPKWTLSITYKGKSKDITRPNKRTKNATNVYQLFTLPS